MATIWTVFFANCVFFFLSFTNMDAVTHHGGLVYEQQQSLGILLYLVRCHFLFVCCRVVCSLPDSQQQTQWRRSMSEVKEAKSLTQTLKKEDKKYTKKKDKSIHNIVIATVSIFFLFVCVCVRFVYSFCVVYWRWFSEWAWFVCSSLQPNKKNTNEKEIIIRNQISTRFLVIFNNVHRVEWRELKIKKKKQKKTAERAKNCFHSLCIRWLLRLLCFIGVDTHMGFGVRDVLICDDFVFHSFSLPHTHTHSHFVVSINALERIREIKSMYTP